MNQFYEHRRWDPFDPQPDEIIDEQGRKLIRTARGWQLATKGFVLDHETGEWTGSGLTPTEGLKLRLREHERELARMRSDLRFRLLEAENYLRTRLGG